MAPLPLRALAIAVFFLAPFAPVRAAQQLIPAPYPESLGGSANIGGEAGGARPPSRHQHLVPEPVPQSLGPNALGNPEHAGAHGRQRLLRTPYWRQYHRFQ